MHQLFHHSRLSGTGRKLSGGILIEAPQEKDLPSWREEAEQFLDFVRSPNLIGGAEIESIDKDEGLKRVQESEYVSMEQ